MIFHFVGKNLFKPENFQLLTNASIPEPSSTFHFSVTGNRLSCVYSTAAYSIHWRNLRSKMVHFASFVF